ncbi:MAG: hypothetical protein U1B80_07330, partial [Anaerolineaceae bacterium]|nr:hypothetical protein [Anaerolineaceae bacterium]
EIVIVTAVLVAANTIAILIKPMVAFPPVFFTMLMSSALGALFYKWRAGPTMRCLLFGGIPVILSANFIIGGSLIGETLKLEGFGPVLAYGFFGQVLWMFGGIALLMLLGKTTQVRNLAPAMAGSLSHAGLTGACTAGDMGEEAQRRAPIMINIPFLGHIFLFTIVAFSLSQDRMLVLPVAICALAGVVISLLAFRVLRRAQGVDKEEVKGLMLFSFGWQLTALFGGFLMLSSMPLARAAMAKSSALSHFGLFAALQGGLFGPEAAALISFVFAMPFLVHPLVFLMFGRGMEKGGEMPRKPVYGLALLGIAGVIIFTLLTLL